MPRTDVTQMPFAKLYPLLVQKAEKKLAELGREIILIAYESEEEQL